MSSYKDLIAWQKAMALVKKVFLLTNSWNKSQAGPITIQLQRAALSVPLNIAEGWGRETPASYLSFLRIARGSLNETETLFLVASDIGLLNKSDQKELLGQAEEVSKILNGLMDSIKRRKLKLQKSTS